MRIVFFDGYCSLCNGFVDWIMPRDRHARIQFASLQGETAKKELPSVAKEGVDPDTVVYLREGRLYERSTAILYVLKDLGGFWALGSVFFIVPRPVRDLAYAFVAKNRFRWFGRRETCRMPLPSERSRLLP